MRALFASAALLLAVPAIAGPTGSQPPWVAQLESIVQNIDFYAQRTGPLPPKIAELLKSYDGLLDPYNPIIENWALNWDRKRLDIENAKQAISIHWRVTPADEPFAPRWEAVKDFEATRARHYPGVKKNSQAYAVLRSLAETEERLAKFIFYYTSFLIDDDKQDALEGLEPKVSITYCENCMKIWHEVPYGTRIGTGNVPKDMAGKGPKPLAWLHAIEESIVKRGWKGRVTVTPAGCRKKCFNNEFLVADLTTQTTEHVPLKSLDEVEQMMDEAAKRVEALGCEECLKP
jgi:hypothetical protein